MAPDAELPQDVLKFDLDVRFQCGIHIPPIGWIELDAVDDDVGRTVTARLGRPVGRTEVRQSIAAREHCVLDTVLIQNAFVVQGKRVEDLVEHIRLPPVRRPEENLGVLTVLSGQVPAELGLQSAISHEFVHAHRDVPDIEQHRGRRVVPSLCRGAGRHSQTRCNEKKQWTRVHGPFPSK